MSENVKNNNVVHPADALAAALDRAGGLLAALMDLYDSERQSFVGGNVFIVHGFATANELIDEAGRALADLHDKCDLTLLNQFDDKPAGASEGDLPRKREVLPEAASASDVPHNPVVEAAVKTLDEGKKPQEQLAQNYRDFLEKITKAEALASPPASMGSSVSTGELLPMLQALRKEIQKIPGVA